MSKNVLIGILTTITVVVCVLNYRNTRGGQMNQGQTDNIALLNEVSFLERSYDHAMLLYHENKFPVSPLQDIVLYYSGESCSTCVQDFLLKYKDLPGIEQRLLIVFDNQEKEEVLLGFNDAFGTNYNYVLDTTRYFTQDLYEVLILKMDGDRVSYALEYRPDYHELFDGYFKSKGYVGQ